MSTTGHIPPLLSVVTSTALTHVHYIFFQTHIGANIVLFKPQEPHIDFSVFIIHLSYNMYACNETEIDFSVFIIHLNSIIMHNETVQVI